MTSVPFSATLRSEWTKLTALRSTWIVVALAVALSVALSAITAIVIGATWDDASPSERADFDPISMPLIGALLSGILFTVLAVRAVTSEYASGMMRLTLTATPRRDRVLVAKVCAVSAITVAATAVAVLGMFLVGQAIFAAYDLETASLGEGDALRLMLATLALTPVDAAIAIALAFLLRSTAGAITTLLAMTFAPAIFGSLLPQWVEDNVLDYLPAAAGGSITSSHLEDAGTYIAPGLAAVVLALWVVAFLGSAGVALVRRDA